MPSEVMKKVRAAFLSGEARQLGEGEATQPVAPAPISAAPGGTSPASHPSPATACQARHGGTGVFSKLNTQPLPTAPILPEGLSPLQYDHINFYLDTSGGADPCSTALALATNASQAA
jgi:hypothetical protein